MFNCEQYNYLDGDCKDGGDGVGTSEAVCMSRVLQELVGIILLRQGGVERFLCEEEADWTLVQQCC